MIKLFAYGTLLDKKVQMIIIGRTIDGTPDSINGFTRIQRKFQCGVYPDIEAKAGESVQGQVFELTEEELARCDEYEGIEYKQIQLITASGVSVIVYKGIW
jgi:gamma-glutamylcyclotransferase (GGCT)/AIG2-like uncharacterized protein YtfP